MKLRYGRARCTKCDTWYDIDEGHLCPSAGAAAAQLAAAVDVAAALPDLDRPHPPALTWFAPPEARPIALGPSTAHPEVRPALALDADRFWSGALEGLADWPAVHALEDAVEQAAFTTDPYHRRRLLAAARVLETR